MWLLDRGKTMPDGSRGAFIANVVTEARRALPRGRIPCRVGYPPRRLGHRAARDAMPGSCLPRRVGCGCQGHLKRNKRILPLGLKSHVETVFRTNVPLKVAEAVPHWGWAHPGHVCAGTELTPAKSAAARC